ncbi:MAG: hypothetical protein AB1704_30075 [Pseudomonadota bacterium]|uniref:hypothetical protein n=2 Tax=Burkholderiales TaxID=80840 RepID=UPI0010F8EE35|nr:hypothetical protein [Burkholderia sp. 4M9327F10]
MSARIKQPNRDLQWVRMPTWWASRPEIHETLADAPAGDAIAALKLYLGLCANANRKPTDRLPQTGSVEATLSEWSAFLGLSRPMVIAGLSLLVQLEVIERLQVRPSIYRLVRYEDIGYWTRLPHQHLAVSRASGTLQKLVDMTNRSVTTLHALQLYVYLASIRDRKTLQARVSYTKLTDTLHMSRASVARGLSILVNHDLVNMRQNDYDPVLKKKMAGVYWLKGRIGAAGEDQLLGPAGESQLLDVATSDPPVASLASSNYADHLA